MRTLNLGILAHVDAGKTSLTERLLHAAGAIDALGSVDHGSTRTDTLALERQRGITIKSAVASLTLGDTQVNLIDTPGHPDFIAEVERVLGVLDGAILVISAVEGIQAQTRLLMRALQRLRRGALIFINKTDRAGAQAGPLLGRIHAKLSPDAIPMGAPTALGTPTTSFTPHPADDTAFRTRLLEQLTEHDDALLAAYLDDETAVSSHRLRTALAAQCAQGQAHPLYFGSAITGAGIEALTDGITTLLPAATGTTEAPASGTVFKIERGPAGEKIAYARVLTGTVSVRDRIRFGDNREGKITAVNVFDQTGPQRAPAVQAGQIGKLWGLTDIQVGDTLGDAPPTGGGSRHFAAPTLETIVVPAHHTEPGALYTALAQLAEQDPLIGLRRDEIRHDLSVSLYGEVQKEVIGATLSNEYGLDVEFRETTPICIERPAGTGAGAEFIVTDPNPFLATVGLRVSAAPTGSGVTFGLDVELGSLPYAFIRAVEETVHGTLRQGLHGWQVTDCAVTMTHSGYWARQSSAHGGFDKSMSSTAGDFRNLTPLVLMDALRQAGTIVFEPMHRFNLELPADTLGMVLPALSRLGGIPAGPVAHGDTYLLDGELPAAAVHTFEQQLPGLTRGEGVLESAFERHRPVTGQIPTRPRTDHNPLNRKDYLLQVVRRVS